MNFKTTAVLIVLLAALGGFAFLMKDRSPSYLDLEEARKAAAQGASMFAADELKAAWVDTLSVNQNGKQAKVTLANDEWQQVEPVHFSLSSANVQEVLESVANLKYTDVFMPGEKDYPAAEQLGFGDSATALTLAGSGDHVFSHQLTVGKTIVGGKLYVMRDDDPKVYVVSDTLAKLLSDEPVHRWRIRSLTGPGESQAFSIAITGSDNSGTKTKLEVRKEYGRWTLKSPDNGRADRQAVASLLTAAQATTITRFIADAPDNLATYGLVKPAIEMTILSRLPASGPASFDRVASRTQVLKIGAPADLQKSAYFASWTQNDQSTKTAVFTVGKEAFERFSKSADSLRDPLLTPLAQGEIKQLKLSHDDTSIAFSRSAKGWEYDQQQGEPSRDYLADDSSVSRLVAAIAGARATRFVPSVKTEAAPLAMVTLTGVGQASPDELRIWAVNEKDKDGKAQWLVIRNEEPVGRVVLVESLAAVMLPAWQFRDRELADLTADKINQMVIIQADGSKVELTRTLPTAVGESGSDTPRDRVGPWTHKGALAGSDIVDPTLPAAVVSGVSPLRVASWLPPEQSLEIKQGSQGYDLTVSTSDGKTVHLKMNEEGHAQMDGQSQVFVLAPALRDAIKASYGKHSDPSDTTLNMTK